MRVARAALELFAENGVSGTSLQMIADAIGVTKAAVYHQFNTKEAIVVAAVDIELGNLEGALDAAEIGGHGAGDVDKLLIEVIDLAVGRRRIVNTLLHDPVILRLVSEHEPFRQFMARLYRALLGRDTDATGRVRVAMITSAIGGVVTHPLVSDLDDDRLRDEILELTRRFLNLEA
jgi:AcrR family transcriptional regulator